MPAFGVAGPGHVRVGKLVDQRHFRLTREHGVDVHLLELGPPIVERLARDDLELTDLRRGEPPGVGLHEPDHDVGAAVVAAATFVQHREGLADAGCGAQVDAQLAAGHAGSVSRVGRARG